MMISVGDESLLFLAFPYAYLHFPVFLQITSNRLVISIISFFRVTF